MKTKSVLFLSSLLMVGSLASCGNGGGNKGDFTLVAVDTEIRWSERKEVGFFFEFDPSTKLGEHKVSDIKFSTSKANVTIQKMQGEGENYLHYKWRAISEDDESGSFTLLATIDTLKSNTLTLTIKPKETFIMECSVPDNYKIQYYYELYNGGSKVGIDYTVTKIDGSFMFCKQDIRPWGHAFERQKFYKKQEDGKLKVYTWRNNQWTSDGSLRSESEVLSETLDWLRPDPVTRDMDYARKENGTREIDGITYDVVRLRYYYPTEPNAYREFEYYSKNGLSLSLKSIQKATVSPYATLKGCYVGEMGAANQHPFDPPAE